MRAKEGREAQQDDLIRRTGDTLPPPDGVCLVRKLDIARHIPSIRTADLLMECPFQAYRLAVCSQINVAVVPGQSLEALLKVFPGGPGRRQ